MRVCRAAFNASFCTAFGADGFFLFFELEDDEDDDDDANIGPTLFSSLRSSTVGPAAWDSKVGRRLFQKIYADLLTSSKVDHFCLYAVAWRFRK